MTENKINNNPLPAEIFHNEYHRKCIKIGTVFYALVFILSLFPALTLWVVYGVIPSFAQILQSAALIVSASLAWWIVEPLSYFPVFGTAGTYMSFLVGSMNIRLPSAIAAQSATDSEPGSQRGELMATLGIAGSLITSGVFVTLGAFVGTFILSGLPEYISVSFQYVPAAIYATFMVGLIVKRPDLSVFGAVFAILLIKLGVLVIPSFLLMLLNVTACAAFGLALYKRQK